MVNDNVMLYEFYLNFFFLKKEATSLFSLTLLSISDSPPVKDVYLFLALVLFFFIFPFHHPSWTQV